MIKLQWWGSPQTHEWMNKFCPESNIILRLIWLFICSGERNLCRSFDRYISCIDIGIYIEVMIYIYHDLGCHNYWKSMLFFSHSRKKTTIKKILSTLPIDSLNSCVPQVVWHYPQLVWNFPRELLSAQSILVFWLLWQFIHTILD